MQYLHESRLAESEEHLFANGADCRKSLNTDWASLRLFCWDVAFCTYL